LLPSAYIPNSQTALHRQHLAYHPALPQTQQAPKAGA
jgi:hypothetical protein